MEGHIHIAVHKAPMTCTAIEGDSIFTGNACTIRPNSQNDTISVRVDRPRNSNASTNGRNASRSEILLGP